MKEDFLQNTNMFDYFSRNRIFIHLAYWILWVCFFGFMWGTYDHDFTKTFLIEIIELPVKILLVYVNIYWFMPYLLFQRKYIRYIVYVCLALVIGGLLQRTVTFYFIEPIYWPERLPLGFFKITFILTSIIGITTPMIIPSMGKLFQYWYRGQQDKQSLEHENLQVELKLLKSQINPHFLFNTLNSLYALSLKQSDKTSEVVMKLSELMHYMLYECKQPKVYVSQELQFIRNYIALEKVRFGERFHVNIKVKGDVNHTQIAPLILLPFVENCFKHGVNSNFQTSQIDFKLEISDHQIFFELKNSLQEVGDSKPKSVEEGFGLRNLRRRLELIYPEKHDLRIEHHSNFFQVKLSISL
ncbi:sensor histidine kinase [Ancylomarina longa]|nr:sensor histidine kinase [Ancylomarina longa]